jgi:hypothetical protein
LSSDENHPFQNLSPWFVSRKVTVAVWHFGTSAGLASVSSPRICGLTRSSRALLPWSVLTCGLIEALPSEIGALLCDRVVIGDANPGLCLDTISYCCPSPIGASSFRLSCQIVKLSELPMIVLHLVVTSAQMSFQSAGDEQPNLSNPKNFGSRPMTVRMISVTTTFFACWSLVFHSFPELPIENQ